MTRPNQTLEERSSFGDSSWPLFSIYSDAAKQEDSDLVKLWQKDAEGIIIFTGLFSAALSALLAVIVQDLRPNIQATSAFHLGNIYQLLADSNVTRPPTPSSFAKLPLFSPPRNAVWVNSLWFLSLVMSLSCALWATSLQQWTRRYLLRVQPAQCSPDTRARMRAFYADGVDKMHISWAVEKLPELLHLSLFLFFAGLAIFLFNVNHEVFSYVIWWIVLFLMVYVVITLLPIVRHDSAYYSPHSALAWMLYTSIAFVTFKILALITYRPKQRSHSTSKRCHNLANRYHRWLLGGVEKAAEETVKSQLPKIDGRIFEWTITALGNDDSLEKFFEAIPGFLNSNLVKGPETDSLEEETGSLEDPGRKLNDALHGFCDRTLSSDSASDADKLRRIDISLKAMSLIRVSGASSILHNILFKRWDEMPQTLEMGHGLAHWCTVDNKTTAYYGQSIIARILASVQERDNNWISLAARTFGPPEHDLWKNIINIGGGDSRLLAIFIHVTRQSFRPEYSDWMVLEALSKLDICKTLPSLQHDFCTLWNEVVQEARKQGPSTFPVHILKRIRHLYNPLHTGIDAPKALSASTNFDPILRQPLSYPLCKITSHRPLPDALPRSPTDDGNTVSRQARQVNNVIEPPSSSNPMTTSKTGATRIVTSHTSHWHIISPTNPVHPSSRPTGALPTVVVPAAPQYITSTATLSHPQEESEQEDSDMVASGAEPGNSQILTTASTHAPTLTLAPTPTSLPNTPSDSYDAGAPSVSNSSHFTPPFIRPSIPASPSTGSATLGLVDTGNICFANTVLQLLVNLPPFWNLFRELDDLKRQRGAVVLETGRGATPLVEATDRLFKEFIIEESPSTLQQSQLATGGTSRADLLEPTYMYDAMKEKRQLTPLLDGQQQDAAEFLCLYLDALEEELPALFTSISGRLSACPELEVEEREVSQSGQTEVGSPGFVANLIESPIARIFGGKFRSPIRGPIQPGPVPTENWRSLHLDIQHDSILTVQDALAPISQSQFTQISASGLGNANQQALIEALPPVLVLHLNRVRYDAAAGGITKIGKSIQFAPELEISLDFMVPNTQRPSEPPHYKLYGVLYHHGESAGSGHYTVDVLHPNGNGDTGEGWLHIDNEVVSRMRREDVFGEHGSERAADERCAYLLFYCRTPVET